MQELILHLIGDYVTQSDDMANKKRSSMLWAAYHALIYSLPFVLITQSVLAWVVIFASHAVIDRFGLARYLVYAKNLWFSSPKSSFWQRYSPFNGYSMQFTDELDWENCKATGYPSQRPAWLAVWLLIAADNTLHLAINHLAIKYL